MDPKTKKKKPTHYVDNKELLKAIKKHRKLVLKAQSQDKALPRIPEYIGDCFLRIATHYSYKANFSNYTYTDDMIMDAVENCLKYINNFNSDKYDNPFSYFTQVIHHAFVRRIKTENKQRYIKLKAIDNIILHDDAAMICYITKYGNNDQHVFMQEFIEAYETAAEKKRIESRKKKAKIKPTLEFEEDDS